MFPRPEYRLGATQGDDSADVASRAAIEVTELHFPLSHRPAPMTAWADYQMAAAPIEQHLDATWLSFGSMDRPALFGQGPSYDDGAVSGHSLSRSARDDRPANCSESRLQHKADSELHPQGPGSRDSCNGATQAELTARWFRSSGTRLDAPSVSPRDTVQRRLHPTQCPARGRAEQRSPAPAHKASQVWTSRSP